MKNLKRWLCFLMALVMPLCLFGCSIDNEKPSTDLTAYYGTWQASDHDEENVVHYLVFDNDGYWNIYMNYTPLVRAIKQLPEQLVSFKIFCQLQNSGQTRCYYEYVKNENDVNYADIFTIDDDGRLTEKVDAEVYFTKVSTHTGEPDEVVVTQAKDLFDRAREEALS